MDVQQAMRAMVDGSGMTHRQISARLGRYDSYVSQLLTRQSVPSVDTVAQVAHACGYRLELVPIGDGRSLTIGDDDSPVDDRGDVTGDAIARTKELLTKALANLDAMESD
jgi:transcriptional regulator with XRE-family HTH domain